MVSKYIIIASFLLFTFFGYGQEGKMALIKEGTYIPLYGTDSGEVQVSKFYLDVYPVTNGEYIEFLKEHPKWRKSKVVSLFAEDVYLNQFQDDLNLKEGILKDAPVTYVSWFAAKEYCKCQGKRLPTIDEWEYVAMADETSIDARKKDKYNQYILGWYEQPYTQGRKVGSTFKNYWGVYDVHGLIWEWTEDFNSIIISGSNREGSVKNNLFCGGAAIGATHKMDYAAFMRYAFRASIKGNYALKNLGFRCAQSKK